VTSARPAPRSSTGSPATGRATSRLARNLIQLAKFGLVGGSGFVVNMAVAVMLNLANGGPRNAQNILFGFPGTPFNFRFTSLVWLLAFLVANTWNFQLNRSWTFRSAGHARWAAEFWPFLAVGSVAALAGWALKIALTNPTSPVYLPSPTFNEDSGLHSREYWAQLIAIVLTMPINFVVNKVWTFRAVRSSRRVATSGDGR